MNLQQLRYVKALVDKGSFVAAASSCAVTQPTLSNGIAQIESELGHRLFLRTTRTVKLTPYGVHLLPTILEILSLFEQLKSLSKTKVEPATGALQVGISPLVGVKRAGRILSAFKTKHPSVEVVFRESDLEVLGALLNRGVIDIVIAPYDVDPQLAADGVYLSLEQDPLLFLPKIDDRAKWSNVKSVSLNDIADETFIMLPDGCGLKRIIMKLFENSCLELKRYSGEASGYAAIKEFADSGLASGILPNSKIAELDHPAIPIVQLGQVVSLQYFVRGKPSTISADLFSQLWDTLLEDNILLKESGLPGEFPVPSYFRLSGKSASAQR